MEGRTRISPALGARRIKDLEEQRRLRGKRWASRFNGQSRKNGNENTEEIGGRGGRS